MIQEKLNRKISITVREICEIVLISWVLLGILVSSIYNHNRVNAQEEVDTVMIAQQTAIEMEIEEIREVFPNLDVIGAYAILNHSVLDPNRDNVQTLIDMCDYWYPDIVLAQYILESIEGTSKVAKRDNNLFGMKKAFSRPSVRCKSFDSKGYAVYNNWQLSVVDRRLWDNYIFKDNMPSRKEYLAKIKHIYAEDPHYIKKLEKIISEL